MIYTFCGVLLVMLRYINEVVRCAKIRKCGNDGFSFSIRGASWRAGLNKTTDGRLSSGFSKIRFLARRPFEWYLPLHVAEYDVFPPLFGNLALRNLIPIIRKSPREPHKMTSNGFRTTLFSVCQ